VLVVSDGTEMPPEDIVRAIRDKLAVTLLAQTHGGPAAARNTGAARARGTVLAFIDDDCAPSANWLEVLAKRVATSPDCTIGGHTVHGPLDNSLSVGMRIMR